MCSCNVFKQLLGGLTFEAEDGSSKNVTFTLLVLLPPQQTQEDVCNNTILLRFIVINFWRFQDNVLLE